MTDLAASLSTAWTANTRQEKGRGSPNPRAHVWASGWKPCERAMCLDMLHPEDSVFEDSSLEAFAAGDAFERDARARMVQAGRIADPPFEVIRDQEYIQIKGRSGKVVITGKMDGVISFMAQRAYREDHGRRAVLEFKGGNSVDGIGTLADFETSRWARGYPRQVAAYMLGLGIRRGVLVLKQRSGAPSFIEMDLEDPVVLEMAEDFLARAERCVRVVETPEEKRVLPVFTDQPGLCQSCDHRGKSCAPPIDFGEGLRVVTDPALIQAAADVVETVGASKNYNRAHGLLSTQLRPLLPDGRERVDVLVALGDCELRGAVKRRKGAKGGAFSFEVVRTAGGALSEDEMSTLTESDAWVPAGFWRDDPRRCSGLSRSKSAAPGGPRRCLLKGRWFKAGRYYCGLHSPRGCEDRGRSDVPTRSLP